jgi:hypothetical protein
MLLPSFFYDRLVGYRRQVLWFCAPSLAENAELLLPSDGRLRTSDALRIGVKVDTGACCGIPDVGANLPRTNHYF